MIAFIILVFLAGVLVGHQIGKYIWVKKLDRMFSGEELNEIIDKYEDKE